MSLQDRLDSTSRRADALLNDMARREIEREAREDAERMVAEAAQARADSEKKRVVQTRYDDVYRDFGTLAPAPLEGESVGQYRKKLYEGLRRRLPSDHELFGVRADDIPGGDAARNFERMLLDAAKAEAAKPSPENLPPSGELIKRIVTDADTGAKTVEWHGRRSFIADLNRPTDRVLRIINPKTGAILHGEPLHYLR